MRPLDITNCYNRKAKPYFIYLTLFTDPDTEENVYINSDQTNGDNYEEPIISCK